ncbi:AhpC/TSA family protein [bacterium SCSIO 12741]|nr:AhpC/TSA family protein [bacterium SCSIO 12741]
MKKFALILMAAGVVAACNTKPDVTSPTGTILTGKLTGVEEGKFVVLQKLTTNNVEPMDTLKIDAEGNYRIGPSVNQLGFYRLFVANNNFVNVILGPNDTVTLNADASKLEDSYEVVNSEETSKLKEFNDLFNGYVERIQENNRQLQNAQMNQDFARYQTLQGAQQQLQIQAMEDIKKFVGNNSNYLASLSAIRRLDPEQELALYEKVSAGLESKISGDPLLTDFNEMIERVKALQVGGKLPDISLPDENGTSKTLYSMLGKVTLVDFWAAWCRPCRAENPNVVSTYNQFKSKGFDVIGISLDKNKEQWQAAIAQDNLTWTHLSDLQQWNSVACKVYNVNGIPANFLVDENGTILARNLRGPDLPARVAELVAQ